MKLNPHQLMTEALAGLRHKVETRNSQAVAQAAAASRLRGKTAIAKLQNFANANMHSDTAKAIYQIESNAEYAVEKLAAIGYDRLCHMRSHGLTFPEISRDMGINVSDIIEFMRLSPTAYEDALQYEESCADARTMHLEEYVKNEPLLSRNDTVRLQLMTNIQLEMNKRLSPKWAKGAGAEEAQALAEAAAPATITMIINNDGSTAEAKVALAAEPPPPKEKEPIEAEFRIGLPGE